MPINIILGKLTALARPLLERVLRHALGKLPLNSVVTEVNFQPVSSPEQALSSAPAERQPWIALEGFGVAHYGLLLGVVALSVGIKKAIGHAYDPLTSAQALALRHRAEHPSFP